MLAMPLTRAHRIEVDGARKTKAWLLGWLVVVVDAWGGGGISPRLRQRHGAEPMSL